MGQRKNRLERFLKAHPTCCFCGGVVAATTRDHIPPSSVFSGRKWPEGYEFPACYSCNNGSSRDDAVIALYSRFGPSKKTEAEQAEFRKYLRAFNEIYPGESRQALLSANEKRRYLEHHRIAKPDGVAYGELPIIKFPRVAQDAITRFSRKMILALHYKHTGQIVPSGAWIETRFWTNLQRVINQIPQELFNLVPHETFLRRGSISLDDQFSYRFNLSEDEKMGAYMAAFGKSFLIMGLLSFDAAQMENIEDVDIDDALKDITAVNNNSDVLSEG